MAGLRVHDPLAGEVTPRLLDEVAQHLDAG
jgi:hypothetical protein